MTQDEYNAALSSGAVKEPQETAPTEGASTGADAGPSSSGESLSQFIPFLTQLQSTQRYLSAAPTFIPQTFQDQIQFVFDGTNYYLFLYFNNQWNSFSSTGASPGVIQIIAGFGISISPGSGVGTVTVVCTITDATLPTSDITTNNVSTSKHGFAPKLPNDATKFLNGVGAFSVPPGGGSGVTSGSTGVATVTTTGTQTIAHGLGRVPVLVKIDAARNGFPTGNPAYRSSGAYDGTNQNCVCDVTSNYAVQTDNSHIVQLYFAGGNVTATISWDATNIYLVWAGGLGSVWINWTAI